MDYHVQRCTRRCAKTQRLLKPGETFYSALVVEGPDVVRYDYARDAWDGPPEGALGWWKSQMPSGHTGTRKLAPSEVLLRLFDRLQDDPQQADMLYVLTLLLTRRRILRLEPSRPGDQGAEQLVVYCPRREATYLVPEVDVTETRIEQIQGELADLLFSDDAGGA